jgi:hypothetical protein
LIDSQYNLQLKIMSRKKPCQFCSALAIVRPLAKQRMQMQSEAGKKRVDEMLQTLHTLPSSLTDTTLHQQAVPN